MQGDVGNAPGDDQPGGSPEASLAGLVAARICHDLVGPVGAIGNGLDLVREVGASEAEDLALIAQSAERAAALLKLHRLAFGRQSAEGEAHDRRDLHGRLEPVIGSGRVAFAIAGTEGPPMAPATARLAALMALAGQHLAGAAGRVSLSLAARDHLPIALVVEGRSLRWTPEIAALIRDRRGPSAPGEVDFALLPIAARAAGARIASRAALGEVRLDAVAC